MNGEEHISQVPQHIKDICDALPHFGDAWHMQTFRNLQGNEIMQMTPPERTPLEKPKFFSKVTLMTQRGPVDIGFEIPQATSLSEAEHLWRDAAQAAIVSMHREMQKNQRRVLTPQEAGALPFPKKIALN